MNNYERIKQSFIEGFQSINISVIGKTCGCIDWQMNHSDPDYIMEELQKKTGYEDITYENAMSINYSNSITIIVKFSSDWKTGKGRLCL